MAKFIVEYKLHKKEKPYFIEDGGYFPDSTNPHKRIGVTEDDACCYIPLTTLVELTNAQLITRVEGLSLEDPMGNALTTQEKTDMANDWLTEKGFI